MIRMEEYKEYLSIIDEKVVKLRSDLDKLKAVDDLIGKKATDTMKHNILDSIFVLQDVKSSIIDYKFESHS